MIYLLFIFCVLALTVCYRNVNGGQTLVLGRRVRLNAERLAVGALIVLIVSLFCGLRAMSVGTDTQSIYYPYYYVAYCLQNRGYEGTEIGFYLVIRLGYLLFRSYTGVLVFVSFLTTLFFFAGLARYQDRVNLPLCMLLFLVFLFFPSFNIMRQMLAVSVVVFALRFLEEERAAPYLVWVAAAALVHNSAVVALVLLAVQLSRRRRGLFCAFLAALCCLPLLLSPAMALAEKIPFLSRYAERYPLSFDFSVKNLSYVIYFFPAFAVLLYHRRALIARDGRNVLLLVMALLVFECSLFKFYVVWLSRLMNYFLISFCVLLPQCVALCRTAAGKSWLKLFLIAYCIGYFVLFYIVLGNSGIYPYESVIGT